MANSREVAKAKDVVLHLTFGGFLFLVSFFTIRSYVINKESIPLLIVGVLAGVISLLVLTSPLNHLGIVKVLHWILGWGLGIQYLLLTFLMALTSTLFTTVMIFGIVGAIIFILISVAKLFGIHVDLMVFQTSILYVTSLATAIIVAYFGDKIMLKLYGLLLDDGDAKEVIKGFGLRVYRFINLRKRVYEISILLYVFSVVEKLSGLELITWKTWVNYKEVALEILLSFVAIDAYVTNFVKNRKTKKAAKTVV